MVSQHTSSPYITSAARSPVLIESGYVVATDATATVARLCESKSIKGAGVPAVCVGVSLGNNRGK